MALANNTLSAGELWLNLCKYIDLPLQTVLDFRLCSLFQLKYTASLLINIVRSCHYVPRDTIGVERSPAVHKLPRLCCCLHTIPNTNKCVERCPAPQ